MKGSASTYGAITVTNALPTGVGCAAGVALRVDVEVSLDSDGSERPVSFEVAEGDRSPVVEESFRAILARYHPEPGTVARLTLHSEVPVGRGLKSSSAVSTAVILAAARAAGKEPSLLEVGRLSAEVSRRVGVSATGALDDAMAGLETGFVVTDNRRDELLRRTDIDPTWGVVLYVPPRAHPPATGLSQLFAAERKAGELSARAAMDGDWARAMRLNTELVERAMGYPYQNLRERLRTRGALMSGVSGFGPALAAIGPRDRLPDLLDALPDDSADRMAIAFSPPTRPGGGCP